MTLMLLLAFATVYRVTRLLTVDTVFERFRLWAAGVTVTEHQGKFAVFDETTIERPMVAKLLSCMWCLSVWVGAPVVTLAVMFPDSVALTAIYGTFAASAATGWLGLLEERLDNQ